MDDRAPDPQCPRCRAVSSVVPAPTTLHQWCCEACNLLFSTTAETDPDWADHARQRWLEAHDSPKPPPTELGQQLAARARTIPTQPPTDDGDPDRSSDPR